MARQTCAGCHFLVKELRDPHVNAVFSLEHAERDSCRKGDFSWRERLPFALGCHPGVWHTGQSAFDSSQLHEAVALTERHGFCFYIDYRPGMLLPAAKELQLRESARAEATRDRRLAVYGLWIAALALVAQLILEIIGIHFN